MISCNNNPSIFFYKINYGRNYAVGMGFFIRNTCNSQSGASPLVLEIHFCDGYVKSFFDSVYQASQNLPLIFQRHGFIKHQINGAAAYNQSTHPFHGKGYSPPFHIYV